MIRKATNDDAKLIISFVKELAKYERLEDMVICNEIDFKKYLSNNLINALLIYHQEKPIGFSVYFYNFSTFYGKPGLYIEDLFILEEYRHLGYGYKTLKYLAKEALNNDCMRMEWSCLDWNTPSIQFYENKIGAKMLKEWKIFRLTKNEILKLGESLE